MTAFVDTCILISLLDDQDKNHLWSVAEISKRKRSGPMIICDIVYCEASIAMNSNQELDEALDAWGIERLAESDSALFRAGRAFKKYKEDNKGPKLGVVPDFLIGAVAEVNAAPLISSNRKDFTGYFPAVKIVSP